MSDIEKRTANENEALALLYCNSFPILGVLDEFIVDTQNLLKRSGGR